MVYWSRAVCYDSGQVYPLTQSVLSNKYPEIVTKDFVTIRDFFRSDQKQPVMKIIGKLYEHLVQLHGDQYEAVLRNIYYYLDPNTKMDDELVDEAEMMLMEIAARKTEHKKKNNTAEEDLPQHVFIFYEDPPFANAWELAMRMLFHHLVKLDGGQCGCQYNAVLVNIYKIFYVEFENEECCTLLEELVAKLNEIVDMKMNKCHNQQKNKNNVMEKDKVMGNNGTEVVDVPSWAIPNDGQLSQIMKWAISGRLMIQEYNFKFIKGMYHGDVIDTLHDHMLELDGGQCRYQYMTVLRKIYNFLEDKNDVEKLEESVWIDGLEIMLSQIAARKIDENQSHQKYKIGEKDLVMIKSAEALEVRSHYDESKKKIICVLYNHLLKLDGGQCRCQYEAVLEIIKKIIRLNLLDEDIFQKFKDTLFEGVVTKLKEIASTKKNENHSQQKKENVAEKYKVGGNNESEAVEVQEDSSDCVILTDVLRKKLTETQHEWLLTSDVVDILQNSAKFGTAQEAQRMPPSGSVFLYNKEVVRNYKEDGYDWKKQKNGTTVTEGHAKIKEGDDYVHCYYGRRKDNENFRRRTYWLRGREHIALVQYLEQDDKVHKDARCKPRAKKQYDNPCKMSDDTNSTSYNAHPSPKSPFESENEEQTHEVLKHFTDKIGTKRLRRAKRQKLGSNTENEQLERTVLLLEKKNEPLHQSSTSTGLAVQNVGSNCDILGECVTALDRLDDIDPVNYSKAFDRFVTEPIWREPFLRMSDKRKKDWVLNTKMI